MRKIFLIFIIFMCAAPVYSHYVNVWDKLNVHSEANANSPVIDCLERGKFVSVQKQVNDWTYVKYVSGQNYKLGYVNSSYIAGPLLEISPKPINPNSNQYAYEKELYEMNRKCNVLQQKKCLNKLQNEDKNTNYSNKNFEQASMQCYFYNQGNACIGIDELRLLREKYNIYLPKYQDNAINVRILN